MQLSPDLLLTIFKDDPGRALSPRDVVTRLGAPHSYHALVLHLLEALVREGRLVGLHKKRFILPAISQKAQGVMHVSAKGTGFLLGAGPGGDDLYVHRSNLDTAIDGDTVEVEVFPGRRGEQEGRVLRVIERAHESIVGQFVRVGRGGTVTPRNAKIGRWVEVRHAPPGGLPPDGAWVRVRIHNWSAERHDPLIGAVEEVLGMPGERGISVLVLLRDVGVDLDFPATVNRQAGHFHPPPHAHELERRLDLRERKTFTIDPATAKDFDDALSIDHLPNGNWRLGVHIADVAHYVQADKPIDAEALKRGTSIYPVDRVVPMLPERLSDDLCSLRPGEDRYALSVFMDVAPADGAVTHYEISESVIRSRHRLNYAEVQDFFDRPDDARRLPFADAADDLLALRDLSRVLNQMRMARGALDLDLPESEVLCNPQGDAVGLARHDRFESHRLVEECMLIANETVARHLRKAKLPFLYRIHDLPDPASLERLAPALALFGAKVPKKIAPSPQFYQPIVERPRRVDGGHIGLTFLLRSLMRAEYSPENRGHFGLASKCYCHFTSPIRRYPDLLVHRALKAWLRGEADDEEWRESLRSSLDAVANQCNLTQERAEGIEREARRVKAMEFMKDQVGDVSEGWISGVVRKGFFVELVDYPVDGFVDARSIGDDHYAPDEFQIRMVGRRAGRTFRLGQRVRVQIIRVDAMAGEMDLELVGKTSAQGPGKKGKKQRRRK
ncbi:MAG TPA: ribonuclease R [Sumerlaeia bacterium]|nr:ribonuclease R [Sumerlaeia bacterium]